VMLQSRRDGGCITYFQFVNGWLTWLSSFLVKLPNIHT